MEITEWHWYTWHWYTCTHINLYNQDYTCTHINLYNQEQSSQLSLKEMTLANIINFWQHNYRTLLFDTKWECSNVSITVQRRAALKYCFSNVDAVRFVSHSHYVDAARFVSHALWSLTLRGYCKICFTYSVISHTTWMLYDLFHTHCNLSYYVDAVRSVVSHAL